MAATVFGWLILLSFLLSIVAQKVLILFQLALFVIYGYVII